MKSHRLQRYHAPPPPPPPPKPTCNACKCYAPEVVVPLGEGAIELCWLCAHHHVDHGVPLSECATSPRCEHTASEIYPERKPHALEVVELRPVEPSEVEQLPRSVPEWRSRQGRAAGMPGASYPRPRRSRS